MRRQLRRWARNPINRGILRKALDGKTYKILGNLPPKDKDILVEIVDMRAPKNYYAPWVLHDLVFKELFLGLMEPALRTQGLSSEIISFLKEDSPKVRKWLTDYEELSKRNKAIKQNYPVKIKEDPKAIETIQTKTDLHNLLKRLLPDKYAIKTVPHNLPGVIEYSTSPPLEAFRILKVEGEEGIPSLMELAQGTEWCTTDHSASKHYLSENPVIVILKHDNPVVQAHVGLDHGLQIMNVQDQPIDFSSEPDKTIASLSPDMDPERFAASALSKDPLVTVGEVSALLKSMHFFERAFTFYEKKLTSSSPKVVMQALGGVSALGSDYYGGNPRAVPIISKLLYSRMPGMSGVLAPSHRDSDSVSVREMAASSMGNVGTPQAAFELVKALSTTSTEPEWILGRNAEFFTGWKSDDHTFRIAILKGLRKCGGSREIPLLRELAFQHIPLLGLRVAPRKQARRGRGQLLEERRAAFRTIGDIVNQADGYLPYRPISRKVSSEETEKRLELAIPILASALIDSEDIISNGEYGISVVQDAAKYLGQTRHVMAVPPLIEALRLEHLDVGQGHQGRSGSPKNLILNALKEISTKNYENWLPSDMILTALTEILNERPLPNFIVGGGAHMGSRELAGALIHTISAVVQLSDLARDNTALINAIAGFIRDYLARPDQLVPHYHGRIAGSGKTRNQAFWEAGGGGGAGIVGSVGGGGYGGLKGIITDSIELLYTIALKFLRPDPTGFRWSAPGGSGCKRHGSMNRLGKDAPGFPSFSLATAQLCMLLKETGQGYDDSVVALSSAVGIDASPKQVNESPEDIRYNLSLYRAAARKTSTCIEKLAIRIQNDAYEILRKVEPYVMISDILANIRLYSAAIDELAKLAIPTILETSHQYMQMLEGTDRMSSLTKEADRMIFKMVKILDYIAGPFTLDPINTIYESIKKLVGEHPLHKEGSRSATPVQSRGLKSDVYTIVKNHKTFGERGNRIAWLPFVDPRRWPRWVKNKVEGCDICAEPLTDCECEPRKNPYRQLELFPSQPYPHPMTGDIVTSILDKCQPELRRIGIELNTILGCGDYGCAFLTSDGRVAKFTKTKKEADAAHFILNHPNPHKSLPRVDQVWILEGCHEYGPLYVILREDLDDLNIVDRDWFAEIMDQFEYELYSKAVQKDLTEDDIYGKLADLFGEIPGRGSDELQVENLADLFVWNMKNGLWLDDIIVSNWGQRADGTIVVRDLGAIKILN